uniref:Putative Tfp pilus assembly protein PilW n=1 Tax=mine drainage metagenome TaxID=410659 RepID=E6QW22_9ZZZZ
MNPYTKNIKFRANGFSLIEVMVGMVVGLATIIIIMQSFAAFEGQKRTTTSGADSQENGLIALRSIESDARMSGYGLLTPGGLACVSMNTYYNGTTQSSPIAPVLITDGGNGASDAITFTYSNSPSGSSPAVLTSAMPTSASYITMDAINMVGFNINTDKFIVATPSTTGNGIPPCSRLAYVDTTVTTPSPAVLSLYNPPSSTNIFPTGSVTGYDGFNSFAVNMGNFIQKDYQVISNALATTDVSIPNQPAIPFVDNVVNIQAQYGIAPTNPSPGSTSPAVNCWTDASGNACNPSSGNWSVPAAVDIMRIKAIRVAIVVRSAIREKPQKNGICNTTITQPISWIGGPNIDLSISDPNYWQCHRYRVYQTIIPLRNVIWANL